MPKMNEAKKRDFVDLVITTLEQEKETLTNKGFDPSHNAEDLKARKQQSMVTEMAQQDAAAKAKEATAEANNALDEAYKSASNMVDLISGLLGKDNELVKKIRKIRN